jgi:hypothetical protein
MLAFPVAEAAAEAGTLYNFQFSSLILAKRAIVVEKYFCCLPALGGGGGGGGELNKAGLKHMHGPGSCFINGLVSRKVFSSLMMRPAWWYNMMARMSLADL